jgi:hypothetical protein
MSPTSKPSRPERPVESTRRIWPVIAALAALAASLLLPATAAAHGPVSPAASSYLARIATAPPGTAAEVIDGDQRIWLRVDSRPTLLVLDYRGAPYLRFSPAGVEVNRDSSIYYLNQVPAEIPPAGLGLDTPPRWSRAGPGHEYSWHDGRLHALASTALAPGASYIGRWTIPVRVNDRPAVIAGGLFHADDPSLVWFWPILVVAGCVLAVTRVRRSELDVRVARVLALVALVAFVVAGASQQLHGRPAVSAGQLVVLAVVLAFAAWGLRQLWLARHGWFTFFALGVAALWEGASQITVLLDGFVLVALPAFVARAAVVACLAAGIGLLPLVFRMAERPTPEVESGGGDAARRRGRIALRGRARVGLLAPRAALVTAAAVGALAAAGCAEHRTTSARQNPPGAGIPSALVREARPIGRGRRFQPPATGPIPGPCRRALEPRYGVHVELFAADRVVLIAAGIGARGPLHFTGGRISRARCYGDLVTLEPTGVVLVRPGRRLSLANLFAAWGQPLSRRRLASFSPPPGSEVTAFVNGRRWSRAPVSIPLAAHDEIVLEVGPHVPPHSSYTFPPGA